jgi:dipeptide/tripeptide permease
VINGLGNLGGFCGPYLVGVMMYLYGQNVAVCALAGSLIIAGTMTFLLPKQCDLEIGELMSPSASSREMPEGC